MRLSNRLFKSLVLLLILRAVFAPLTVRAAKSGQLYRARVVVSMRHCWPQQRLERFSSTSKVLKLFQGKHKTQTDGDGQRLTYRSLWFSPESHLTPSLAENVRPFCLDRSAACPRC